MPKITSTDIPTLPAEVLALKRLADRFAVAMKAKLLEKYYEGRRGWDRPELRDSIREALVEQTRKNPIDPVDVANLAAFLWNLEEE